MNSNQKGKRGEREWRDVLIAKGFSARRGQQFAGGTDSPDVICPELSGYHFEVKRVEKLNIENAITQAEDDSGPKIPVVAHKKNRGEWLVTMRADDWLDLVSFEFQDGSKAGVSYGLIEDQPITPMPVTCCKSPLVNSSAGFMVCPECGGSWGKA